MPGIEGLPSADRNSYTPSVSKINRNFFKGLGLSKDTLQRLRILTDEVAQRNLSRTQSEKDKSEHTIQGKSQEDTETKRLALETLGRKIQVLEEEFRLDEPGHQFPADIETQKMALFHFAEDIALLFGNDKDREFYYEINRPIFQLARLYDGAVIDQEAVDSLKKQIGNLLTDYCISHSQPTASDGLKIVANLLQGFKVKILLNGASNTHAMLKEIHGALEVVAETKKNEITDPQLRREAYAHIKLLQERTQDLVSIEKLRKRIFPLNIFSKMQIPKLERRCQDIKNLVDKYYKDLNFTPDEVEEFRSFSLDAHHPKREHLLMFVDDILKGASLHADNQRHAIHMKMAQASVLKSFPQYQEALGHEEIDKLFELLDEGLGLEKEAIRLNGLGDVDSQELRQQRAYLIQAFDRNQIVLENMRIQAQEKGMSLIDLSEKFLNELSLLEQLSKNELIEIQDPELEEKRKTLHVKEAPIKKFESKIAELATKAYEHPDIGNSNPKENLARNAKEWRNQQKIAQKSIQGLFDELKAECFNMNASISGDSGIEPSANDLKLTAELLTKARNEVLADKMRWDKAISRELEVPGGPGSMARKEIGKLKFQHLMHCPNRGYPSSAFRGREASPECILPNFHHVQLKDGNGSILCDYTTSATTNEFFQTDSEKRKRATEQQTGEILLQKVDSKLSKIESNETQGQNKDDPVVVDVLTTLLLSPDTLRGWLMENPGVNEWLTKRLGRSSIDPSQQERRILEESIKTWMAFSKESKDSMPPLIFKDKLGRERILEAEENSNGERVFALRDKDLEGNIVKTTYVQFDVSCYNVGCNKWTKITTNFLAGKSVETFAKIGIALARKLRIKFKGMSLTQYSGELGNKLEDEINKVAFQKDTKRFEAKLKTMKAARKALEPQLTPDEVKIIHEIEEASGYDTSRELGVSLTRFQLHEAEEKYYSAVKNKESGIKALDDARKQAFFTWQEARQKLAFSLNSQLARKDLSPSLRQYLEGIEHQENLRDLFHEISDQFQFKEYRSSQGMKQNMYSLSSALVAFGVELEADPHTCCRSGKDRTSVQRMEIGTRFLTKNSQGRHLNYREIEEAPQTFETREQMLLNSGQIDEIPFLNTGSFGLNLNGSYGNYLKNFGNGGEIYPSWYEKIVLYGVKNVFSMRLK